jgi:hypothetical protein
MEAPITKHQYPEKHQAPITQPGLLPIWDLGFGYSLVLGAWLLGLI